jgi:uncharacterized protein (UPF0371 family)
MATRKPQFTIATLDVDDSNNAKPMTLKQFQSQVNKFNRDHKLQSEIEAYLNRKLKSAGVKLQFSRINIDSNQTQEV